MNSLGFISPAEPGENWELFSQKLRSTEEVVPTKITNCVFCGLTPNYTDSRRRWSLLNFIKGICQS